MQTFNPAIKSIHAILTFTYNDFHIMSHVIDLLPKSMFSIFCKVHHVQTMSFHVLMARNAFQDGCYSAMANQIACK